jgi:5-methylthioribose kinase
MSAQESFVKSLPQSTYIDLQHTERIAALLYQNNWIAPSEKIVLVEKPGEGNMNFVVRVKTNTKSIIIKQSRPWVEKYPQIEAPANRIEVEAQFYSALSKDNFFRPFCPKLIGFDKGNFLLAMEDLGEGTDCTFIYKKKSTLENDDLDKLVSFISHLHNSSISDSTSFPENRELKTLNHTHIFYYPFEENNGFDLDSIQPGLQALSIPYKTDPLFKQSLKQLGEVYLQTHHVLIHGDYYPGSWLKSKSGIKVIDPEFAHFGKAEFDLGVMVAHLIMAQVNGSSIKKALEFYKRPNDFDNQLFLQFCGVEIMRRIIGLAQLPLDLTLQEKSELLDFAYRLITLKTNSLFTEK